MDWVDSLTVRIRKAIIQNAKTANVKSGKLRQTPSESSIHEALKVFFPTDSTGTITDRITATTLEEGLHALGLGDNLNPTSMVELMAYFDLDGDGIVQMSEFVQVIFAGSADLNFKQGEDNAQYANMEAHDQDRKKMLINTGTREVKRANSVCAEAWDTGVVESPMNYAQELLRKQAEEQEQAQTQANSPPRRNKSGSVVGNSTSSKIIAEANSFGTWSDSTAVAAKLVGVGNGVPLSEATLEAASQGRSLSQTQACLAFFGPHATAAVDLALGLPPCDIQVYTTHAYHHWSEQDNDDQLRAWQQAARIAPAGSVESVKAQAQVSSRLERKRRHKEHGLGMGMPASIANGCAKPPPTTFGVDVNGHGPGGSGGNPFHDERGNIAEAPIHMPLHVSHVAVRTNSLDDKQIARAYSNKWRPGCQGVGTREGMPVLPEMQSALKYPI